MPTASPAPPPFAPAAPPPTADGDARLDAVVVRVLQADDVPAFSKAMQELMAAIGRDDGSAQRLASVVLRDYALTVKVLRAANTAHYNRGGRAVQSATHALMLLGARTVRDLASALLLFEHYRRRSPGLKELMLLSLLTASAARAVAERCGPGVDADAAYLAGMFRNLGEVMAAAHLPDEYAAALAVASPSVGAREAPRTVPALTAARTTAARGALGCAYEDIGVAVARHWGMPDTVRVGMRATGGTGDDLCATCTAFAHDLTTAVYRADATLAPPEIARLLAHYGERLRVSREALTAIVERAVDETREVFAAAGVRLDDLRLARQVACALISVREGSAADAPAAAASAPVPVVPTAITTPTLVEIRARFDAELAAAAADLAGYDVQGVLLLALEAVLRGGPFDRACFHAADPVACEFRPRTGLGDGVEKLLAGPGIAFGAEAGPVGPALRRGDEVHLAHGVRLTPAEALVLRRWAAVSAAVYPLRVGGAVIGCVHADRHTAFAAPEAAALAFVRGAVRTLEHAFETRRGVGVPPAPAPQPVGDAASATTMSVKMDAVLRLLRGEPLDVVAAAVGAPPAAVAAWRAEFLAGAAARLAGA